MGVAVLGTGLCGFTTTSTGLSYREMIAKTAKMDGLHRHWVPFNQLWRRNKEHSALYCRLKPSTRFREDKKSIGARRRCGKELGMTAEIFNFLKWLFEKIDPPWAVVTLVCLFAVYLLGHRR